MRERRHGLETHIGDPHWIVSHARAAGGMRRRDVSFLDGLTGTVKRKDASLSVQFDGDLGDGSAM